MATDGRPAIPARPSPLRPWPRAHQPLRRHRHLPAGIRLRHGRHFGYELFMQQINPSTDAVFSIASLPDNTWPASLSNYQFQRSDVSEWPELGARHQRARARQRPKHGHCAINRSAEILPAPADAMIIANGKSRIVTRPVSLPGTADAFAWLSYWSSSPSLHCWRDCYCPRWPGRRKKPMSPRSGASFTASVWRWKCIPPTTPAKPARARELQQRSADPLVRASRRAGE